MKHAGYGSLLKQKGFSAFLATQFLGALNDNLLKWVITFLVMAGLTRGGSGSQGVDLERISLAFILPSLVFTGLAGWLADSFEKRKVLIATKAMEIGTMGLAWLALRAGDFRLQLGVLVLLAAQFTFFGPAKYGIVPELVRDEDMSRANGLLEMSTFLAILLGSVLAGPLFVHFKDRLDVIAAALLGLALLGSLVSLGIGRVRVPAARAAFRPSLLWSEIVDGTRALRADRRLWLANLGIAYFWFQGALFQLAVVLLGRNTLHLDEIGVAGLGMALALGIGAGSMLAGRWSGDKIELGLVPLGSLGMAAAAAATAWAARLHPGLAGAALFGVGLSAGLFVVPLNALLQQKAPADGKGRVQAAGNFYSTLGIIASALCLGWFNGRLGLGAGAIVLLSAAACLAMTAWLAVLLPEFIVRFSVWLLTHSLYRVRIEGAANVPQRGPALLVCNHMSLADGVLVQSCVQRFVRFMVYRPIYESRPLHWLFRTNFCIPVSARRADALEALERAKAEIQAGHVVCIFAEGGISRTGNLLRFKKGLERIMDGVDAPIIPVHLDGLWGSVFSFRGGKPALRLPERLPFPVTVSFGAPLPPATPAPAVRRAVQELSAEALGRRLDAGPRLEERFLRAAKRHWFSLALTDSSGAELGYGRALGATLALAGWMRKNVAADKVGILLPPSVPGALANLAAAAAGKASVNLNFTAGPAFMAEAAVQCGLDTVLTSRRFLDKAGLEAPAGAVFVEDLFTRAFSLRAAAWTALAALLPARLLARLALPRGAASDLATVIFSSGSTGVPKGVMLSHRNVAANVEGATQVLQPRPGERLLGVLPHFHSLGYTGCVWLPLLSGIGVVMHPSPLDAAGVGRLAERHRAALLFSTPTFCQGYVRKVEASQFAGLRHAVVGAEKLRAPLAAAFAEKFGLDLLEGYGCTEMAPLVALNVPDVVQGGEHHVGRKPGTVGAPVPGVAAKVVDLETGAELAPGEAGLLLVKGPNRMLGYLGRPDLTAAALVDGWYATGDVASIDEDGFITLTDRLSRFSKIGGEMVPHLRVEDALVAALAPEAACVVCSVPDESKGERLAVLHTDPALSPEAAVAAVAAAGLPKLWVPKKESVFRVESIPTLGSGKTDLRGARELALALADDAGRKAA